nr:DNA topoisomerase (ATP-hydrolyzing) [Anaerotalea alkaliphila]
MRQSYIDYAMSVIAARALPDIRDGLKPVQRRTLYAMEELNLQPEKSFRKSARIVGDTMGKYHPHGDSSIYDAMVRMAQDFSMEEPLVHGHGNFGSLDGDRAAAMRYTEAKLRPLAMEMLQDLEKGVVPMDGNFDETLKEPRYLPAKFPNALVNGMTGIAVGMATSFPTHNLREVCEAAAAYLKDGNITLRELLRILPGPDFPTGGIVANGKELEELYATGKGRVRIRARMEVVEEKRTGRLHIVVREIPHTLAGGKGALLEAMEVLVKDRKLPGVEDIRDESSRGEVEIILVLKKGTDPEAAIQALLHHTRLEDVMGVQMLALLDHRPKQFNLLSALEAFATFQREVYTARFDNLLEKARDKKEVEEGLLAAYASLDAVLEAIRGAQDVRAVRKCLETGDTAGIRFRTKKLEAQAGKFRFTPRQAGVVLEMRLQKLVGLEALELEAEHRKTLETIARLERLLGDEKELDREVIRELRRIGKVYGRPRRTEITDLEKAAPLREAPAGKLLVVVDGKNYVKALEEEHWGRLGEEPGLRTFSCDRNQCLYIFDSLGNLYRLKVEDIPLAGVQGKGTPLSVLTGVQEEKVLHMDTLEKAGILLFATRSGLVKKVLASEFATNRQKTSACRLQEGDGLCRVLPLEEGQETLGVLTEKGYLLRVPLSGIPVMKKTAQGASLVRLGEGDRLLDIRPLDKEEKVLEVLVDGEVVQKTLRQVPLQERNAAGRQAFKNARPHGFLQKKGL